jgi:PilZ domain-containing protein
VNGLRCRLLDQGGRERTGEVLDLVVRRTSVHLSVRFGPGEGVVIPLGDSCDLALFGPDLYKPHGFKGRAERRTSFGRETYRFRIDPARRFELELVVGGRETLRVQPKPGQPITAELILPGKEESIPCPLHDASVAGLSVEVGWADEKRLVHTRELQVLLHLPVDEQPTPIPCRVRRRTVDGEHIVYGLALDGSETPLRNPSVRSLAAWVEARYQDLSGGARVLRRTA